MGDKEFDKHFYVIHKLWETGHFTDWPTFIVSNLNLLPVECVKMMALDMPVLSGWSESVIEGAKDYLVNLEIEDILLMDEKE